MILERLKYLTPFSRYPYKGEFVDCPVCSSNKGTHVANFDRRLKRLSTFACDNCGLLYTNPMPTDEELQEYYTRLYRLDYQGASDTPKIRHLRKRTKEAEFRTAQLVPLLKPASRTLDFGCGSGELLTCLLALGHDAHGFEPGITYGEYARSIHGERVKVQGWQNVSYDEGFDLVTCFHVLEHLRNPIAALQQMAGWTRPHGLVYIEVPDMGSTKPNKGFGALHFAHLAGFNFHNLLLAGSLAGLQLKVVVSPTGLIFEHGLSCDRLKEAENGRHLAFSLYAGGNAIRNYFHYQFGKVLGQRRTKR